MWYVYIVSCSDKTFYTGITKNLRRRIKEHNYSDRGAKYTRGRRPVKLVYSSRFKKKAQAAREEYRIRNLSRNAKIKLAKK